MLTNLKQDFNPANTMATDRTLYNYEKLMEFSRWTFQAGGLIRTWERASWDPGWR